MVEPRRQQVKSLLADALEREPSERRPFIDAQPIDPEVRREVLDLMDAHDEAGDFMRCAAPHLPDDGPRDTAAPMVEIGTAIGPYHITELIGEGGFGTVYLAEQRRPVVRQVALKIIKWGMDTREVIARFEVERQALAMMEHPNIARVFDAGATSAGRPYFVMELVRGVPITDFCARRRLPLERRLDLFVQVCAAVQHAHTKGVIHRDLKPGNVLVSGDDAQPTPKVIDFGIAKATASRFDGATMQTECHGLMGTPEYMSPEQADPGFRDIDTRADVYSLGVLLYELLTGATPFDRERMRSSTFGDLQRIIREEDPVKPSTRLTSCDQPHRSGRRWLACQLHGDLDWITLKALRKDREQRYGSPGELAADIQRHLAHEPVSAGPPTFGYRLGKLLLRRKVETVSAALILLAILGGVVGTTLGMLEARRSEHAAIDAARQADAVNAFMRDVLTRAEPDRSGADVRLLDVLDDASRYASERFAGHPMQEAKLRGMLGDAYSRLDRRSESAAEYAKRVQLLLLALPADHPSVLQAQVEWARSLVNQVRVYAAQDILDGLLPTLRSVMGPNDELTMAAEVLRASAVYRTGRIEEAQAILDDVRRRAPPDASDQFHIHMLNTAISVSRSRIHGRTTQELCREIRDMATDMIERASRLYGADSMPALWAGISLADMTWRLGDPAEAVRLCEGILAVSEQRLGECHTHRLACMETLAYAKHRLGQVADAAELRLRVIQCARRWTDDPVALLTKLNDALPFLDRGGPWDEGEAIARELAESLRRIGGGHDDMLTVAELYIARFVSLQGRFDEAEEMFDRLLAEQYAPLQASTRAQIHLFHGSQLARQRRFESAEAELLQAAHIMGGTDVGTTVANPDDIVSELIALYEAWGRADRALALEPVRQAALRQDAR